jgi:pSer/pThr/pTyr-binding forkhead associated (FHA) protein
MGVYKPTFRFVWTEHGAKKEAALSEFPICIGRDPKVCHIVVNDASVSRAHAKISFDGSGFFVEDAGSSNGTKADGVSVLAKTALSPGCEIELGLVRMRIYNG